MKPTQVDLDSFSMSGTAGSAFDVLVVIDHYLPGRLAGGPVTTLSNLVQALGRKRRFLIVTLDHDLNGEAHPGIEAGRAYQVGNAPILYLASQDYSPAKFAALLSRYRIPVLYLNSFFAVSTVKILLWNRFRTLSAEIIVAPRGEFSAGALGLKSFKKRVYLKLFRTLGLGNGVRTFQVSTVHEERDVWKILGPVRTHLAVDLPASVPEDLPARGWSGTRFVFLSRISPMKNLAYALERLQAFPEPCEFHIYGPLEDQAYWATCQEVIRRMPAHIHVEYLGTVSHEDVARVFSGYDALLFPSKGENYGHVVYEALSAGCPVIMSDRTPWQDLDQAGVGWVCRLEEPEAFLSALTQVVKSDVENRQNRAEACRAYARRIAQNRSDIDANLALFPRAENPVR